MITMKQINRTHVLLLDIKTDKSHFVAVKDIEQKPILTFDSSLNCTDSEGNTVARISSNCEGNWVIKNELGIETTPVSMNEKEGVFKVEAEFCQKWLELQEAVV